MSSLDSPKEIKVNLVLMIVLLKQILLEMVNPIILHTPLEELDGAMILTKVKIVATSTTP